MECNLGRLIGLCLPWRITDLRVYCLTKVAPYLLYIRMTTATAKVFKSGNSQAVRLPKAFRLSSKTVMLVKTTDGFTVSDPAAHARRLKAFLALAGSCPDFPEIPSNAAPNIRRDWE